MTIGSINWGGEADDWYAISKQWSGVDSPKILDLVTGRYVRRKQENPYQMAFRRMNRVPSTLQSGQTEWTGWVYGQNCVSDANQPTWDSNAELALLSKLAEKIKGHDFNAGIAVAESGKSLAALRNAAIHVFTLLRGVLRRDVDAVFRSLARIPGHHRPPAKSEVHKKLELGDIAGVWLMCMYAWRPLISDAYEACKAIKRIEDEGYRSLEFKASHSIYGLYEASASPAQYSLVAGFRRKVKISYLLREAPSEQETWGLYDPLSIAWELVPFSFVIDWFIPVGSFLESRTFFGRLSGNWVRSDFNRRWVHEAHEAPIHQVLIAGSYQDETISLTRTVGSGSLDVPYPSAKAIGKALSKEHLQNAAALVVALTTGARRELARNGFSIDTRTHTE